MLLIYVFVYVIASSILGYYLTNTAKDPKDFAVAGNAIPLHIATITVFATWFGAECILGIPAALANHGSGALINDPICGAACLIFIGIFISKKVYNLRIISIGDLILSKYGPFAEVFISFVVACSYFGWIAAQFIAIGELMQHVTGGALSKDLAIIVIAILSGLYNYKGGMNAVAINDFIHTFMIIFALICLLIIVMTENNIGLYGVYEEFNNNSRYRFRFDEELPNIFAIISVSLAMVLGTVPQQDSFQRIACNTSATNAQLSTIFGGIIYLLGSFIPIAIVMIGLMDKSFPVEGKVPEIYLISYAVQKAPFIIQVLLIGGLISAIASVISGTTMASSVLIGHNVLRYIAKNTNDLVRMRISLIITICFCCYYAIITKESIHGLVAASGNCSMVVAFIPFVFALYSEKPSKMGAIFSSIGGGATWIILEIYQFIYQDVNLPLTPSLWGLLASIIFIAVFTLAKQEARKDKKIIPNNTKFQIKLDK
ncbi:MAG: hypothetical protein SFT93_04680 [Rickettsiaceae bacterium]|nr:hypothetical protein [Rickettsiaceae bacterium]